MKDNIYSLTYGIIQKLFTEDLLCTRPEINEHTKVDQTDQIPALTELSFSEEEIVNRINA